MREHEHAEHAVGAVDEGEPLLLAERDRGDARGGERRRGIRASDRRPRTSPSPIATSAQWASGARSPEQPSEPYSRTTGVMPGVQDRRVRLAVSRRTPVRPVMSVERRSSMRARTTSRSTSAPEPAACERHEARLQLRAAVLGG
jgi:hypothetical protein